MRLPNLVLLGYWNSTLSLYPSVFPRDKGGNTALKGNVTDPEGFSEGKPEAAKQRGHSPQGFAAEGLPEKNPEEALTLPLSAVLAPEALS